MEGVLVFLAVSPAALLSNTDWKVTLNIGEASSGRGRRLPLPLELRFAGEGIAAKVDGLLRAPKRLEALADAAAIVTTEGERSVPVSAIGWTENSVERQKSLVMWCVDFPEGAARGSAKLPPGRVYCSAQLWQAADLDAKRRALGRLQESMASLELALEGWHDGEGLQGLLGQLADRRRLDERIAALEEEVPDAEVLPVPGAETVIARQGTLSARRNDHGSVAGWLSALLVGNGAGLVQIGTFSLSAMPLPPPQCPPPKASTGVPRSRTPRMGHFDSLPQRGLWKGGVAQDYAHASRILLGSDKQSENNADVMLEDTHNLHGHGRDT